jgi:hypothetical protein
MERNLNIDWEEVFEYLPGLVVELKSCPGVFDTIASYDLMMVPPIWLVNDPCPRYPHELRIVSKVTMRACLLRSQGDSNSSLEQHSDVLEFVK